MVNGTAQRQMLDIRTQTRLINYPILQLKTYSYFKIKYNNTLVVMTYKFLNNINFLHNWYNKTF